MSRRRATAVAALVAAAVPLGSCGSESGPNTVSRPETPGRSRAAASAPPSSPASASAASPAVERARIATADCNLWRALDPHARTRLLADFRAFFGGRVDAAATPGLRGAALSDAQGQRLFASYCRLSFAGAFKLYKLYGRSSALSGR